MNITKLEEELKGKDTVYSCILANEYFRGNEIDKCMEILEAVRERHPQYSPAYLLMAKCYSSKGQIRQAYDALKQCLTLERNNLYAMGLYAEVCGLLEKHDHELATYEELLKFYGGDAVVERKIAEIRKKIVSTESDSESKTESVEGGTPQQNRDVVLDAFESDSTLAESGKTEVVAEKFAEPVNVTSKLEDEKKLKRPDELKNEGSDEENISVKLTQKLEGQTEEKQDDLDDFLVLQRLVSKDFSDDWGSDSEKQAEDDFIQSLPKVKLPGEEDEKNLQENTKVAYEDKTDQRVNVINSSEQVQAVKESDFLEKDIAVEDNNVEVEKIVRGDFEKPTGSNIRLQQELEAEANLEPEGLEQETAVEVNQKEITSTLEAVAKEAVKLPDAPKIDSEAEKELVTQPEEEVSDFKAEVNFVKVEGKEKKFETKDLFVPQEVDYAQLKEKIKMELKEEIRRELLAEIIEELSRKNVVESLSVADSKQKVFTDVAAADVAKDIEPISEVHDADSDKYPNGLDIDFVSGNLEEEKQKADSINLKFSTDDQDKDKISLATEPFVQLEIESEESKSSFDIEFSIDDQPFDDDLTIEENKILTDREDKDENYDILSEIGDIDFLVEGIVDVEKKEKSESIVGSSEKEEEFDFSITDSDLEKFGLKKAKEDILDFDDLTKDELATEPISVKNSHKKKEDELKPAFDSADDDIEIDIESLLNDFRIDTKQSDTKSDETISKLLKEDNDDVGADILTMSKADADEVKFADGLEARGNPDTLLGGNSNSKDADILGELEIEKSEGRLTFDSLKEFGYVDLKDDITDSARNIKIDESELETSEIEHFDSLSEVILTPETNQEKKREQTKIDEFKAPPVENFLLKDDNNKKEKEPAKDAIIQKAEELNEKQKDVLLEKLVEDDFAFEIPEEIENLDKYDADYDAGSIVDSKKDQKMVEKLQSIINSKEKNTGNSKKEAEDDNDADYAFITPTLAELYESQGFLDKAVYMYQKLDKAEPGKYKEKIRELTKKMGQ